MSNLIILIPHYNNPEGLEKSILSIQETISVDILVVDDGSNIKPDKFRLKKAYTIGSIEFLDLDKNQGIEHALNTGLKAIEKKNYDFIGRLDCGDFCKPNRFKQQIAYLNQNEETYLLGTWVNVLDEKGELLYVLEHPTDYKTIKKKMYVNNMFVHPSVVFRSNILKTVGYYPTNFKAAEDYAYFFNIVKHLKAENLPEILVDYIVDNNSISSTKRKLQVRSRIRIIWDNFYFGYYPIYGLLRNFVLLFMSRKTTTIIKKLIGSND